MAVHRVYDEYTALKFTHFGVCSQLFDALAQLANPGEDAIRTVPGLDPDGLHRLAVRLTEATTGLCAALTPTEKGTGYCIAQADGDVRALTKALNAALNGRGGGKPGICQGSCAAAPEQVEEFLREQGKHPRPLRLCFAATSPKGRGFGSIGKLSGFAKGSPFGGAGAKRLREGESRNI